MKRLGAEMPSRNSYSLVIAGRPALMIAALAVVPPMSNTMASRSPVTSPRRAAPVTPPAGPDATANTGRSQARVTPIMPPFDAITWIGASTPMASSSRRSVDR